MSASARRLFSRLARCNAFQTCVFCAGTSQADVKAQWKENGLTSDHTARFNGQMLLQSNLLLEQLETAPTQPAAMVFEFASPKDARRL